MGSYTSHLGGRSTTAGLEVQLKLALDLHIAHLLGFVIPASLQLGRARLRMPVSRRRAAENSVRARCWSVCVPVARRRCVRGWVNSRLDSNRSLGACTRMTGATEPRQTTSAV